VGTEIEVTQVLVCRHGRSVWWRASWCADCWRSVRRTKRRRGRTVLCTDCAQDRAVGLLRDGGAVVL
jgi:hypothetical protein